MLPLAGKTNMEELLKSLKGKLIDVSCGTSAVVRGEVIEIRDGLLVLNDENERTTYVLVARIAFVWEVIHEEPKAGFVH